MQRRQNSSLGCQWEGWFPPPPSLGFLGSPPFCRGGGWFPARDGSQQALWWRSSFPTMQPQAPKNRHRICPPPQSVLCGREGAASPFLLATGRAASRLLRAEPGGRRRDGNCPGGQGRLWAIPSSQGQALAGGQEGRKGKEGGPSGEQDCCPNLQSGPTSSLPFLPLIEVTES